VSGRALRHAVEHACFRVAGAAWSRLPERAALGSATALGAAAGSLLRFRRADVDRHLGWAFPEATPAWRAAVARACYRHFGREAAATVRAVRWSPEEMRARTSAVGFEAFRAAAEAGMGAVLLTGHLGNWEIGGAAIAARGVPLDVVGKGMSNRRFQEDLFALRERLRMRVIGMGDASRLALRSIAAGRVVALLGDQSAHGGGVLVPFFGRPAVTARGPALFAVRSGAPLFVGFAVRQEGPEARYLMTLQRLSHTPSGDVERDVLALTRAYTEILEAAVKTAPEQYFWQHRRWKGAPAEEPRSEGAVITRRPHAPAPPPRTSPPP
jgi:Kdo2-lipid IVA lauroyltransferase/acyltransferase